MSTGETSTSWVGLLNDFDSAIEALARAPQSYRVAEGCAEPRRCS